MKKLIFLLSISVLFQSCFSYKSVNYNEIAIGKKPKVEVKGVGGKNIKGRLVSKNEQTLILESNGALQKIPVSEIYEVSVRKFSFLQSSGLIAGTSLVVACAAVIGLLITYEAVDWAEIGFVLWIQAAFIQVIILNEKYSKKVKNGIIVFSVAISIGLIYYILVWK